MQKACGQDGRFAYQTSIESGSRSPSYNIIRHAGAICALTMLQRAEPNKQIADTTLRAASFLRTYIGPGAGEGQLAVWSKPYPQRSVADLGATGLGLAALTAVEEDKPGSVPPQELQSLGTFLPTGQLMVLSDPSLNWSPLVHTTPQMPDHYRAARSGALR